MANIRQLPCDLLHRNDNFNPNNSPTLIHQPGGRMYSLKLIVAAFIFALTLSGAALAQNPPVRFPRPSPKASVMQTIGVTDVTITYSRPAVKGRVIWGDAPADAVLPAKGGATATLDNQNVRPKDQPIVPYGHVWRTGANEATTFTVTDDVLINGQKLAAGTYSLHTLPGKTEWTIIFNSDAGQWGSFDYDAAKDVLRVSTKPETAADNTEWLDFSIPEVGPNTAKVVVRWERLRVPFTVTVPDVDAVVLAKVNAGMAADAANWRLPLQMAGYYANDKKWDEALKWVEKSIAIKPAFQNLASKSNILFNSGKKDESFAVADQAIQQGKTDKADTAAFERTLADRKAAKN
jgi:hypothetical protein